MSRWLQMIAFVMAMVAVTVAGAQPAPTPPSCAADFDRCEGEFPGEFRNARLPSAPEGACTLGAVHTRPLCAGTFEPVRLCAPALEPGATRRVELQPGETLVVSCAGGARVRPAGPTRVRTPDEMIAFCDPALGAEVNPSGTGCQCRQIGGYSASAPVVVSSAVVNNRRLIHALRVGPHALQVRFGCLYVPAGALQAPVDYSQVLEGLARNDAALQGGINRNTQAIGEVRGEVGRLRTDLDALPPRVEAVERALNAPPPPPATRFGAGIGGFGLHAPGASDFGGFGLSLSLAHLGAGESVGFRARLGLGMGTQPLVPGPGPLWSLYGSAQVSFGRGFVALNAGLAAGALSRFGAAAPGQVAGNTAWFVAAAVGPEVRLPRFAFGIDFLVGAGQTAALIGNQALAPVAAVAGASAHATFYF